MQWQKVRQQHPDTWILAEALQAHTTDDKRRIVEQWDVIGSFPDFYPAFQIYEELHKQDPQREMYVVHTVNEEVQIKERYRIGIRGI